MLKSSLKSVKTLSKPKNLNKRLLCNQFLMLKTKYSQSFQTPINSQRIAKN